MSDWRNLGWTLADPGLLALPNVVGYGAGVRVRESIGAIDVREPVVTVFVRLKSNDIGDQERIPPAIKIAVVGAADHSMLIPTDVVEMPIAGGEPSSEEGHHYSIRAGDRVGVADLPAGTVGCIATTRDRKQRLVVSCAHVLGEVIGTPVIMHLRLKNGDHVLDSVVGRVVQSVRTLNPIYDVALARIDVTPAQGGPVRRMRGMSRHPSDWLSAAESIGRRVRKYGSASKLTCGVVVTKAELGETDDGFQVGGSLLIRNVEAGNCKQCASPHPIRPITRKSDSGSLWVTDEPEPRAVGLHWGGDGATRAYAIPWEEIERDPRLDVTLR